MRARSSLRALALVLLVSGPAGALWDFEGPDCLAGWLVITAGTGLVECSTSAARAGVRSLLVKTERDSDVAAAEMPLGTDPMASHEIAFWSLRNGGHGFKLLETGQISLIQTSIGINFRDRHGDVLVGWAGFPVWHEIRVVTDPSRERYSVLFDGEPFLIGAPFRSEEGGTIQLGDLSAEAAWGSLHWDDFEVVSPPRAPVPAYAIQEMTGRLLVPNLYASVIVEPLNGTNHVVIPLARPATGKEVVMLEYGGGTTGSAYAEVYFHPDQIHPGPCEGQYGGWHPIFATRNVPQRCLAPAGSTHAVVNLRDGMDVPFRFTYAYPVE